MAKKKLLRSLYLLPTILCLPAYADTLRCGNQLVSVGDRAFEVEQKCGAPRERDLLGYSVERQGQYDLKLEEWVYGPYNGMYYFLEFEGNRLVRIDTRRRL